MPDTVLSGEIGLYSGSLQTSRDRRTPSDCVIQRTCNAVDKGNGGL